MRPLTKDEKELITKFANRLAENERQQLIADMMKATATLDVLDGSRIRFEIKDYLRSEYRGQHPFGIEGRMLDDDDIELTVLLHADENGRLFELEFIRWDSSDLIGPKWETLKI
jgi:hypothetical protein